MEIPLQLALAAILALSYWAWIALPRSILTGREQVAARAGTSIFARPSSQPTPPYAGRLGRDLHLFDGDARKPYSFSRGKKARTVDFDYFRTWHLLWTEYPRNPISRFQHVHFLFETNDFDCPTIRVAVPSISYGETWSSKLSILMP